MMLDDGGFLVVLPILYLSDCFKVTGPEDWIVEPRSGGRFKARTPFQYPGNGKWGWIFLNPFRPGGPAFVVQSSGFGWSAQGLVIFDRLRGRWACLPWTQTAKAGEDHQVSLGGVSYTAVSRPEAEAVVAAFASPAAREQFGSGEAKRFDLEAAVARATQWKYTSRGLRVVSLSMGFVVLALFPLLLIWLGAKMAVLLVLPLIGILGPLGAWRYRKSMLTLGIDIEPIDLWGNVFKMALYPLGLLRGRELVSHRALVGFEPVTVAVALCPPEEAARIAEAEMARLRFTIEPPETDPLEREAIAAFRLRRLAWIEGICRQRKIPVMDAVARFQIRAGDCRSYCPCCGLGYTLASGHCTECPNVTLQLC